MTRAVWAKYDRATDTSYPLWAHLEDTAAVAGLLYDSWLSQSQQALLAKALGESELAKKLSVWLAASHDVGKASAAFSKKVDSLRSQMETAGFVFPQPIPPQDVNEFPHGRAGQIAVLRYLDDFAADTRSLGSICRIAEIVGGHHGAFPDHSPPPIIFGSLEDPGWWAVREELLGRADEISGMTAQDWERIIASNITEPVQALLTGFLIVCDWIASDAALFPFETNRDPVRQAEEALAALNFGDHWRPGDTADATSYFRQHFAIEAPRPVQSEAIAVAESLAEPSLMLIEAPTGEGKTEIALAAAEVMAGKFGLHGLMVALPTRATSDAMFSRVLNWLKTTASDGGRVSATLAHGKAQFDQEMESLPRAHEFRTIYGEDRDAAIVAHEWFSGRKKSVFADFVVGTVDQLLFGALKARHLTLRHLGLSSKVIVIDEIHAADTYMQTYLHRVLEWLGAYRAPVIALSATLPSGQRLALLEAYRRGAAAAAPQASPIRMSRRERRAATLAVSRPNQTKPDKQEDPQLVEFAETLDYPLITAVGQTEGIQCSPPRSNRRTPYQIVETSEDLLVSRILTEAANGGCIAVVLDTVSRAQETFAALKQAQLEGAFTGEIQLFHSRFTAESRSAREKELVRRLGKDSPDRPRSLIVVATQVIEASLDVDFDMMFTDFAPIDLLIQRMGRVHRHARNPHERPASMRRARIVLTGGENILGPRTLGSTPTSADTSSPEGDAIMPTFVKGITKVYQESALLRSALALRSLFAVRGDDVVIIPGDVAPLIRNTYASTPLVPTSWRERFEQAEADRRAYEADQKSRSRAFAIGVPGSDHIVEWSRLAALEASEEVGAAQVRDAELSIEVVLVQEIDGRVCSLPWLPASYASQPVDLIGGIEPSLARYVATCTVALPSWLTMGKGLDQVLDTLEVNGFPGWQMSFWLRGVLPLVLDDDLRATLGDHTVRYDRDLGLLVEKEAAE